MTIISIGSISTRLSICTIFAVVYNNRAALCECNAVSYDLTILSHRCYRCHIVIILQSLHCLLKRRYIGIHLAYKGLQRLKCLPCRNLYLSAVTEHEEHIVRIAGIHILEHGITIHSILSVFAILSVLTVFTILSVLAGRLTKLLPRGTVII